MSGAADAAHVTTTAAVVATAGVAVVYAFTALPPGALALLWVVGLVGAMYGAANHDEGGGDG